MANEIITNKAREKMAKARAGDITLSKVVKMAFGSGGVDTNGIPIAPTATDIALKAESLRKDIDSHTFSIATTCTYSCKLLKTDIPNINVNEIALVDADGDLVAIKTFGNKFKDADMEMVFQIDDIF